MHKLGWRASDTRELSFRSCAVPEGNLLGERGRGFGQFMEILDGGRISVAAMGVGLAQGAYDLALAYAKERQQFGRPIASFQAIQFQLADMATEIEAGRQLVYRAAWLKDAGKPFALAAAQAKLFTGLLSNRVVERGPPDPRRLRVHGGVRDLAPLPRPEDPRDRRGHERGAAHGDRDATSGSRRLDGTLQWRRHRRAVIGVAALAALLFAQAVVRLRRRGRADLAGVGSRRALRRRARRRRSSPSSGRSTGSPTTSCSRRTWRQHVLIGDLGPALMVTALRGPLLVFFLPAPILAPLARNARVRAVLGTLLRPRVAFGLWAANLAIWHVPYLYDAALAHPAAARLRARVLDVRRDPRLDAPRRSRLAPPAERRRPRRARGGDVRGRADPHGRARLHVHAALSGVPRRLRDLGAAPTSSSPGS